MVNVGDGSQNGNRVNAHIIKETWPTAQEAKPCQTTLLRKLGQWHRTLNCGNDHIIKETWPMTQEAKL